MVADCEQLWPDYYSLLAAIRVNKKSICVENTETYRKWKFAPDFVHKSKYTWEHQPYVGE